MPIRAEPGLFWKFWSLLSRDEPISVLGMGSPVVQSVTLQVPRNHQYPFPYSFGFHFSGQVSGEKQLAQEWEASLGLQTDLIWASVSLFVK